MASVEKRGEGRWVVRWRDPDGKARARSCSSSATAAQLRRDVEQAGELGRRWEPRDASPRPALHEVAAAWLAALVRQGRAARTVQVYASHLDMFLAWLPTLDARRRSWETDALARPTLEAWYDSLLTGPSLRGTPRSRGTASIYVGTVERLWSWALRHDERWPGHVAPVKRLTVDVSRPAAPARVAPTWVELAEAVKHLRGWTRHAGVVLYFTGLRIQQVMRLRWEDLDLDRGTLTIRPDLGKTRAEKRGRVIPIARALVEQMRTWPRAGGWVVPKPGKPGPCERLAPARLAAAAWVSSGVRPAVWSADPWHCFRAGWQSSMLQAGAPWISTEAYMGHKLPGTGDHYVDPAALRLAEIVELVPRLEGLPDGWAAQINTSERGRA